MRKRVKRFRERWKALEGYQRWGIYLLLEIVAALAAISYLVSKFPEFIPNTAISAIAPSYLIVAVP